MGLTASTDYPPFSLTEPRFDQSTFEGRVRHFREVTDWKTLLTTEAELNQSLELLDMFKNGVLHVCVAAAILMLLCTGKLPPNVSTAELWHARKIKEAIIHPDFNKPIPIYARMYVCVCTCARGRGCGCGVACSLTRPRSAFTPANIPICGLLLWPTNHPGIIIGGQIINQVCAACVRAMCVPLTVYHPQTYNVVVNYGNRSASGEMSNALLAGGVSSM
jgi:hypothetical protein